MTAIANDNRLAELYEHAGPFTTVYLDADRTTENGAHEIELRWRAVRSDLEQQGAPTPDLDAIADAIEADAGAGGRHGLVVVAVDGAIRLVDHLPDPPAQSSGSVDPLPRLFRYVADRSDDLAHVVVVVDRAGAQLTVVDRRGQENSFEIEGDNSFPLHRTGRNQWNERHFQNRVENNWQANAQGAASAVVERVAASAARLVIVAGEVRARSMVTGALRELLPPKVALAEVEQGGAAAGASESSLDDAVRTEVLHEVSRQRSEVLERLQQNLGRDEFGVAGVSAVIDAVRSARADTVVVADDPSSTIRVWVGPRPTDFGLDEANAAATGVTEVEHDRLDSALVRGVYGTGANLLVTPGPHQFVQDGIAALLRYNV